MAKKKNSGLNPKTSSVLEKITFGKAKGTGITAFAYIIGNNDRGHVLNLINKHAPAWQLQSLKDQVAREVIHFSGTSGPVWIIAKNKIKGPLSHHGRLEESEYAWHREQIGSLLGFLKAYQVKILQMEFQATQEEQELGAFVGLELAAYSYKNAKDNTPQIFAQKISGSLNKKILAEACAIGQAVNVARHLVNAPPNELNPETMSSFVAQALKDKKNMTVEIWNKDRLEKEGMGLHLGVGQGSKTPPCLVHIRYRPQVSKNKTLKPIAFVGKGVTFDTGGLDLKPSSNMRLMKKDMGGAAALAGLAFWLADAQLKIPLDIYLGLAENSVDARSMRPSDILQARNGMQVEVHNTDAEGRLVLADVIDVAVTQKGVDEPAMIIDVATLTGAIKAGLGAEIAGLFANHDDLAEEINLAGTKAGELNWRMPLLSRYTRGMDTPFADIVNAVDGFGGAITAALFLEKFIKNKPWVHLDIYSWNDKPTGSLSFAGGNGQPVQSLIEFLKARVANT